MRLLYALLLLLVPFHLAQAQASLVEGVWQGELRLDGLEGQQKVKFELHLKADGQFLNGKTYLYTPEGQVYTLPVEGWIYSDRSIYLREVWPDEAPATAGTLPDFTRKFQLLFSRSIWETTLEGYWQQIHLDPFDRERRRGRLLLQRKEQRKGKA